MGLGHKALWLLSHPETGCAWQCWCWWMWKERKLQEPVSYTCLPLPALGALSRTQSSRWRQVSLLGDLSAYGVLNWIGYLGYHTVLSRALYFAVPITHLCHSAPWLPGFLTVCISVSEYFFSSRCIILCDMVSSSYFNFLLIKGFLHYSSLLTGGCYSSQFRSI